MMALLRFFSLVMKAQVMLLSFFLLSPLRTLFHIV